MVLTMSVPAFADDTAADKSAPVQLTSARVKAIKPAAKAASYSCMKIKVSGDKIESVDGCKVYMPAEHRMYAREDFMIFSFLRPRRKTDK